jgi:hypothetical protein
MNMTRPELALEALMDLVTMHHCHQLAYWHNAQLRYSSTASGYGNPN